MTDIGSRLALGSRPAPKTIGEQYFQKVVGVFFNIQQPEPRVGKLRPEAADESNGGDLRVDRVTAVSLYDMPITIKGLVKLAGFADSTT